MSYDMDDPVMPELHKSANRARKADRACAGLTLPADVKEGAVKRLVEAARILVQSETEFEVDKGLEAARAALRELGVKE